MPAIQVGHLSTERGPCNNCGREEVRVLSGPSEPYGSGYWCDPCLQAYHLGQRTQQDWLMLVCPGLKGSLDRWYEGVVGRSIAGIWRDEEHEQRVVDENQRAFDKLAPFDGPVEDV